jgi:GT2 family glycosyltransferase
LSFFGFSLILYCDTSMTDTTIAVGSGLTSIVIPCCGMLEYTKLCVPSVMECSREPYELIFLDIGSLDGTAEYLCGIRHGLAKRARVEVCRAASDLDIKDACQEALQKVRGEFVVLLNNDTVVVSRWLDSMIALSQHAPDFGMIGPMSNQAGTEQLVETVPYRLGPRRGARPGEPLVDVQAVQAFANAHHAEHRGKWAKVPRLGGFCVLIRRAVLDRVRPALAEWSDLSLFDTDILGSKVQEAGFSLVRASDLFVHHFGTRTFAQGAPVQP